MQCTECERGGEEAGPSPGTQQRHAAEQDQFKRLEQRIALSENLARIQAECIHDLVDVLDPIGMAVEFLRRQAWRLPVEERASVHGALEEAQAGIALARSMQEQLMAVCGPVDGCRQKVMLEETVQQALRLLNRRIRSPIEVRLNIEPNLSLWVEPGKLLRVFLNLLRNALRALDRPRNGPEPPQIRICGREDDGRITIRVRDNGPGIGSGQAQILGGTWNRNGWGCHGLEICSRFIAEWGGTIEASSEPNRFCEIILVLPASAREARIDGGESAQESIAHDQMPELRPNVMDNDALKEKRILLVEDEKDVRQALGLLLSLDDHHITEAADGAGALRLFSPGQFDLVITDLRMPGMAGDELAVRIKQQAPNQPILMITAFAEEARGRQNPADLVLDKPVYLADLRGAIKQLLKN